MNQTPFDGEACERAQAKLDQYIDGQLLTATSLDLMEHFKSCPACAREAGQRRRIRARLRTAVREIRIPAGLADRVRGNLRGTQRSPGWGRLMAIAAGVAVCAGSWITYQVASTREQHEKEHAGARPIADSATSFALTGSVKDGPPDPT